MGEGVEGRREIGLFRYALVRDVADPALSKAQRGRLVPRARRAGASRAGWAAGAGRAQHAGCVGSRVSPGRVRGARPEASRGGAAHAGRGAGAGVLVEARAAGANRSAGQGDHAHRRWWRGAGAGAADVANALGQSGVERSRGWPLAWEGLWPFRSWRAQRAVDGRRRARPHAGRGLPPSGRCCSRSSTITPGCWSGGGGAPARTCSGSKPRCAQG